MRKRNFIDPETKEEFYFPTFSTSFDGEGNKIYKDKYKQVIVNPKTKSELIPIEREENKGFPMVSKYSPGSPDGQKNLKKYFGQRANRFDTKGAGRDTKDQKSRDFKEQVIERAREGRI